MKNHVFIKFTLSICICYISYSVFLSFANLFLQYKNFDNTSIGVFFACSSVFCIIMQIFSGSFLDNHPRLSSKHLMIVANILVTLAAVPACFVSSKAVIFICFVIIGSILLLNSSLYNSFAMEYINAGIALNYSLSRGMASCLYAAVALITGIVIEYTSVTIILPVFILAETVMLIVTGMLKPAQKKFLQKQTAQNEPIQKNPMQDNPSRNKESQEEISRKAQKEAAQTAASDNLFTFFKRNPRLFFLLLSILLLYTSYTCVNNFQINIIENVGGGSAQLGTSTFIAAALELPAMALFVPLSKKFSYRNLLQFSCIFFFLKILSMTFAGSITAVYLSQCLQFFSYALFIPSSAYFMNQILPESDMAKGQTALGIFTFGLSGLIASLLGGVLLDYFSVKTMLAMESGLAFLGLCGVLWMCRKNPAR